MASIALNGSSLNCSMGIGYYTDLNSSFSRSKSSAKSLSDAFASLKQKMIQHKLRLMLVLLVLKRLQ